MVPLHPAFIQELTRLRKAVEASGEVIFMTDRDGTLTYVNPAFVSLYGHTPAEVVGRATPRVLKSGVVPPEAYAALWQALLDKQAVTGTVVNRTKDGRLIEVESSANPIVNDDGEIVGFLAVQRDITERRRAEEALRRREAELNEAQRVAGVGSWEWVVGSDTITWSEGLRRILGLDPSHPAPTYETLGSFYVPESWARLQVAVQNALAGEPYELDLQMIRGDGVSTWTTTRGEPVRDPSGQIVALRGTVLDINARTLADEALRESEARYRTLAESAQDAIFIIDRDLRVLYVNQFGASALASSQTAIVGKGLDEIFPAGVVKQYGRGLAHVLATGEPFYAESPGAFVGRDVMLGTRLVPLRNDAGDVTSVLGIARDITDRWRAERAQQESEERFRALTESASDAIVIADGHGKIVLWNPGAERLFLYSREEATGQPVGLLIPEPYHQQHVEAVQRMHATGEGRVGRRTYESVGVRKDGSRVPVDISLAMWEGSEGRFAGAIIRDVTSRKEAEESIRKREAELKEAQRVAQVGSWEWVVATDTVTWSEELYRINRADPTRPPPTFAGLSKFYTPESWARLSTAVGDTLRTGDAYELDLEQIRTDGQHIWVSIRGEAVRDVTGQIVALRGTVLDITDRKRGEDALRRSEDRLRQVQKMEAVGQLAGGVAHDFNNLLTVILGNASLLMETPQGSAEVERRARTVVESAERGANLTRQLLAFSRRQVIQIQRLALNDLIGHLLKMLGRLLGENIMVRCEYAPVLPPIEADAGMIEQIIMNLAVNARDAMPNGGTLTISTRLANIGATDVARNPDARVGRFVALEVSDDGAGMDRAVVARIFEPFFTTKDVGKGTGLGLATVHGIVSQHQGWIEVASEPGKGSSFTVFFPAAAGDYIAQPLRSAGDLAGGRDTILVVEDEADVRSLAVDCLQRWGYHVLEAANGVEALRVWDDHPGRIDLLLTDVVMPEGITGRELATRLRQRRAALKVIYSSGYSRDALDAESELQAGDSFLPKPYTLATLAQVVRRCLDAS